LTKLATGLGVTTEILLGDTGAKQRGNGPAGKMRRLFESASALPRSQQQKVIALLDAFVAQHTQAREA
jgi:hypothetical protein